MSVSRTKSVFAYSLVKYFRLPILCGVFSHIPRLIHMAFVEGEVGRIDRITLG